MLPLPYTDPAAAISDKDKLHVLETAVVSWTKQIRSVLGADPDAPLKVNINRRRCLVAVALLDWAACHNACWTCMAEAIT